MTRTASRLATLAVALVALFAVAAAPATAKASESALRERAHARIAAVLSDAVNSGVYSTAQENYVTSALLPTYVDPKDLSAKVEEMLQAYVEAQRQARSQHQQQAQAAVADWNALHDASGSFADAHSTL